jgi:hypothetical protein
VALISHGVHTALPHGIHRVHRRPARLGLIETRSP